MAKIKLEFNGYKDYSKSKKSLVNFLMKNSKFYFAGVNKHINDDGIFETKLSGLILVPRTENDNDNYVVSYNETNSKYTISITDYCIEEHALQDQIEQYVFVISGSIGDSSSGATYPIKTAVGRIDNDNHEIEFESDEPNCDNFDNLEVHVVDSKFSISENATDNYYYVDGNVKPTHTLVDNSYDICIPISKSNLSDTIYPMASLPEFGDLNVASVNNDCKCDRVKFIIDEHTYESDGVIEHSGWGGLCIYGYKDGEDDPVIRCKLTDEQRYDMGNLGNEYLTISSINNINTELYVGDETSDKSLGYYLRFFTSNTSIDSDDDDVNPDLDLNALKGAPNYTIEKTLKTPDKGYAHLVPNSSLYDVQTDMTAAINSGVKVLKQNGATVITDGNGYFGTSPLMKPIDCGLNLPVTFNVVSNVTNADDLVPYVMMSEDSGVNAIDLVKHDETQNPINYQLRTSSFYLSYDGYTDDDDYYEETEESDEDEETGDSESEESADSNDIMECYCKVGICALDGTDASTNLLVDEIKSSTMFSTGLVEADFTDEDDNPIRFEFISLGKKLLGESDEESTDESDEESITDYFYSVNDVVENDMALIRAMDTDNLNNYIVLPNNAVFPILKVTKNTDDENVTEVKGIMYFQLCDKDGKEIERDMLSDHVYVNDPNQDGSENEDSENIVKCFDLYDLTDENKSLHIDSREVSVVSVEDPDPTDPDPTDPDPTDPDPTDPDPTDPDPTDPDPTDPDPTDPDPTDPDPTDNPNAIPLNFTANSPSSSVTLNKNGELTTNYKYSTDNANWDDYEMGTPIQLTNVGDKVYFKGTHGEQSNQNHLQFSMAGEIDAAGNVNSLLDEEDFEDITNLTAYGDYTFYGLFNGCTSLTSAPELPATTLTNSCYNSMFYGCSSLTRPPELLAEVLVKECYYGMFRGCTSLEIAPALPATTLADSCYKQMFFGCTLLTTASDLQATTLANNCYQGMFRRCTSLTAAPDLPATTLANYCYNEMFYECTSLTSAPELHATTLATNCYENMFKGCVSLKQAPERLPATTLATHCYNGMLSGCTSLTTAPELPASTLVTSCYNNMFRGCTLLNEVKCHATDISANNSTNYWLYGVSSTGTFYKVADTEYLVGFNGIPSGWTIAEISNEQTNG